MRLFALIGSALVVLLLAALIAPPYVDWNRFKNRFEMEASRALGQRVEVRGQASARLLPLPSVTFTDVRVGPAGRPLLTAAAFGMDVEVAPLLKGDIVIVDMRLEAPKIEARIDTNGTLFWPDFAAPGGDAATIAVESLTVEDGVVRLRDDRYDREFILRDIDAQAVARSIVGPWRGDATLRWQDEQVSLDFSTGRYRPEDKAVSLRTRIEPESLPYDFAFEGPVTFDDAAPMASGLLRVTRAEASDEDEAVWARNVPEDTLPLRFEADVELRPAELRLPAYELRVGEGEDPYTVTGSGRLDIGDTPSYRLTAEGQQVDAAQLERAVGAPSGADLKSRLGLLEELLSRLPKPPGQGQVDVVLPAFVAGDTVIRDIEATVEAEAGPLTWRVRALSAQLPGRTELRADGVLSSTDGLRYEGALTLASRQPTGFAAWLGQNDPAALDGIGNAGFSAEATLAPDAVVLEDLEVVVNGDSLQGRLERRDGQLAVELQGRRAHLDRLRALAGLLGAGDGTDSISDLRIEAESAIFDGIEMNGLSLAARQADGNIIVDALGIADLRGVAIEANGFAAADAPLRDGSVEMALAGPDLAGLVALATERFGSIDVLQRFASDPSLSGDADLVLLARAEGGVRSLSLEGMTGGNNLDLRASLSSSDVLDGRLVTTAADSVSLMRWLGMDAIPSVDLGRGALRATVKGSLGGAQTVDGSLTLRDGYASASGSLTPTVRDGLLVLDGRIEGEVEASDLDTFIALSGRNVPGFGQGHSGRLVGAVEFRGDEVSFDEFAGTIAGSAVEGRLTWLSQDRRLVGGVTLDRADASLAASLAYSPQSLLDNVAGAVELTVDQVDMPGSLPPVETFRAQAIIGDADGDLSLRDASGRWLGGTLSGTLSLARGNDGNIASLQVGLSGAQLESAARALGVPAFGTGRLSMDGTFEMFGADAASMLSGLTGTGSAQISEGQLDGVSPQTFTRVLSAADATDDAALPGEADALVRAGLGVGRLPYDNTAFAFTVNGGDLRFDNVPLNSEAVRGNASGRLALTSGAYEASLDLTFSPGLEAVEGTTPSVDLSITGEGDARNISVDTTGFTTYLNTRLAEKRERQFLARRGAILERQRIQRSARYYALRQQARRLAREERERIEQLRREEAEARRQEAERRRRAAAEQARLEEALKAREALAAKEAAAEAGRRARRQREIDDIARQRERSRRAQERLEAERNRELNFDGLIAPDG